MARFDVHPRPGGGLGYVVNVQTELPSALTSPAVVPRTLDLLLVGF